MKAFLHFGQGNEPRQTIETTAKETRQPRSGVTQTGYGSAMASPYMVQWNGRWHRVYVTCYSNASTAWIGRNISNRLAIVDIERD